MKPAEWIEALSLVEPDQDIKCMYESEIAAVFNLVPGNDQVTMVGEKVRIIPKVPQ